jgi:hypothetical protein
MTYTFVPPAYRDEQTGRAETSVIRRSAIEPPAQPPISHTPVGLKRMHFGTGHRMPKMRHTGK